MCIVVLDEHKTSGLSVKQNGNGHGVQLEHWTGEGRHFEFLDRTTQLSKQLNLAVEIITSIENTGIYNEHLSDINSRIFETVNYIQSSECKALDKIFPSLKDWRHQLYSPVSSVISRNQRIKTYLEMVREGKRTEHEFITFLEELKSTIEATRLRLSELPHILVQNQFPDRQALLDYQTISIMVYNALRSVFFEHEETGKVTLSYNVYNADCEVMVNPMDIRNIIQNFSTNTVRHGMVSEEKINVDVTVSCQNVNDVNCLLIYFSDTGAGMPVDILDKALERGVKGENSPGDGIGLALVKQTVERYNGNIYMRSEEGNGTEFLVELPILA